jgi:hypothetical protein
VTSFTFLLVYPAYAGSSLAETQHRTTIMAERQPDAYRRLWQTIDDMRRGLTPYTGRYDDISVPDVYQWHGPQHLQTPMIAD